MMTKVELENLCKDVENLLPPDHGFVMLFFKFGENVVPSYMSNVEPLDALAAMRAVLLAVDEKN
jgi:hypothetical protein